MPESPSSKPSPHKPQSPQIRQPKLDPRLTAVLSLINAEIHADIGCDHAYLPISAVLTNKATRCVAIELNSGPYHKAAAAIDKYGLNDRIDLRQGNGFEALEVAETDSASLCGMGAHLICQILLEGNNKVPQRLILQPNDSPFLIRLWAQKQGYHIVSEQLINGYWPYPVLELQQAEGADPAYAAFTSTEQPSTHPNSAQQLTTQQLDQLAALRYGPHLLQQASPLLHQVIQNDLKHLGPVAVPGREAWQEYKTAQRAMVLIS